MRSVLTLTAAAMALVLSAPAMADHHKSGEHAQMDHSKMDQSAHSPAQRALMMVLADPARLEESARDQHRNPAKTLAFFQVEPNQRVVEYSPGSGWYMRVLMPYVAGNGGVYMAMNGDSSARSYRTPELEARAKAWAVNFVNAATADGKYTADTVAAFESDEIPENIAGTVDRVLVFRALHGLLNGNQADHEIKAMRRLLKEDGMVGVVQHRAKDDQPYAMTNGERGYLKQSDVIKLFEINGFELVGSSEINANPKDTADHPDGVWEMPPVWSTKREKLKDLGESDRMTLLFKKAM